MIDAISANVGNVPASTPKVGGYVTGTPDIKWTSRDWARFPEAGTVRQLEYVAHDLVRGAGRPVDDHTGLVRDAR